MFKYLLLVLLILPSCILAKPDYFIVAPNIFRFGVEETISINIYGIPAPVDVEVYLQDNPGRGFTFSKKIVKVENEKLATTTVMVKPTDIPDVVINDPRSRIYVFLVVKCVHKAISFTKEALVLVSPHKGYIFIQTDKPIYTPKQEMRLRIIPLEQDLTLMKSSFQVRIVNPQNITVQRFNFDKGNTRGIITKIYKFPRHVLEGIWGVSVEHGHELASTTYVPFQVKKYVLPTFDVKIKQPNYIMEKTKSIKGKVSARYVYDKPVKGVVRLRYGVKAPTGDISYVPSAKTVAISKINGEVDFEVPLILVLDKFNGKFPEGHKFHVEATVVEGVSGKEFTEIDESTYFQKSPYVISFAKTVSSFKIGLAAYIQVQVQYASKVPAKKTKVIFTVKTADGQLLDIRNKERVTDDSGYVQLSVSVPNTSKLTVEVLTKDPKLASSEQGKRTLVLTPYSSPTGGYLGIKALHATRKLKIGDQFDGTIIVNPWEKINRVMFSVIGRGKVLKTSKTATRDGKNTLERTFSFKVTQEMVPSVRIVAFANYRGQLIADSLWVDVEDTCQHDIETSITPIFQNKEPGEIGKVKVKAAKKTTVGLMTVDKAVYVLRNKGRLTAEKVYEAMEGYDIGCGAGGGKNTVDVLERSGVIILTSSSIVNEKRDHFKCNGVTRRKRQVEAIAEKYDDRFVKSCCVMGQQPSKFPASCAVRTTVLRKLLKEKYPKRIACADAFQKCCEAINVYLARAGNEDLLEFVEDLDIREAQTLTRSSFPETWLYEGKQMGDSTDWELPVNLPHSITTWVFQAISVSPNRGLCIAKPKEVAVIQGVFLDVSLPYSIVRNEEIEIKVTVFNYRSKTIPVTVYLYGVEGLCTGADAGKRTKRRLLYVPKTDAVSTGFYIIPLKVGDFKLRFVALSEVTSDVVEKTLSVRAEGVTQYKDRTVVLDPANYNGMPGSSLAIQEKGGYTYFLDAKKKKLAVSLPVVPPKTSLPDTESASIYIIGDSFGPIVKTALSKTEVVKFINKPSGCGEQNMMRMAPTLYTMKYLAATGKIGAKEEKVGYDWIRLGYERQLNYRRKDGGYSAGGSRPSSTWLTAFVMKCFCQAEAFINIDEVVGCTGMQWIVNHQSKDGSYTDKFPVYHQEMVGGTKGTFAMTAFALMSLYGCKLCKVEGLNTAKARAVDYLENNINNKKRPYELAVAVYALTLAKSPKYKKAITLLKQASIFDRSLDQRHWVKGNGALSIEATAYGLMAFILEGDLPYAKPIVNWLNANRGFGGIFKSTQDTVVALQALSEYSIKSRQPKIDLAINLTSDTDRAFFKTMKINNNNYQDLQVVEVSKPGGLIFVDVYGDGIAMLSWRLRYNTPVPPEKNCAFDLKIKSEEIDEVVVPRALAGIKNNALQALPLDIQRVVGARAGNEVDLFLALDEEESGGMDKTGRKKAGSKPILKIEICTQFKGPFEKTSMAIIDVGVFTGYQILNDDLEELLNKTDSTVQQYELSSRGAIFYLDTISSKKKTCLKFRAEQVFKVGAAQRASVAVYDYYKPELTCTAFYAPGSDSVIKNSLCAGDKACICPRGGCSACNAFDDVLKASENNFRTMALQLLYQTCDKHDYLWLISVTNIRKENQFKVIDVEIVQVIKPGIEGPDQQLRSGSTRELITYLNCDCPKLVIGKRYFIMAQDGTKWESEGEMRYRYLINPSAKIFEDRKIKEAPPKYKLLTKAFKWVQKRFIRYKRGCEQ